MAFLTKIVGLVLLLHNVQQSIGLIEGSRGASWNIGGDLETNPGKIIGEFGGDVKNDIEEFAKKAENIGGDIAKAAEEVAEDVGKEVEHIVGDIGEGIEKGAEGIIDGAKGAINGIGGIVGKLTPNKKKGHDRKNSGEEKQDRNNNRHHKGGDDSHEEHQDSRERGHHNKHKKEDSRENHGSHEKHQDKRGRKHHDRHTGRGIDRKTGIGSHDGIKTPILDILGLTKSVCRVSYAAESLIEDLGELHIWADKQMGIVEHAAVNYIIDNIVLKAVDGARKYHNKIVDFVIDTHIGIQKLVTNTIIEAYRVTKAPIRELLACH